MKYKILFSLVVCFVFEIQNVQAQTQEETIEWIKAKLQKHGGAYNNKGTS